MEQTGEPIKQCSEQIDCEGFERVPSVLRDAVREWARCIEQDSQAETFEYLGESVAKQSGE